VKYVVGIFGGGFALLVVATLVVMQVNPSIIDKADAQRVAAEQHQTDVDYTQATADNLAACQGAGAINRDSCKQGLAAIR
jgi:hypothetical protein